MKATIAYILVKTASGSALKVAEAIAGIAGVHWASAITGPYDVIVGVRASDNEALGTLVVEGIHKIAGVISTTTGVTSAYYPGADTPFVVGGAP